MAGLPWPRPSSTTRRSGRHAEQCRRHRLGRSMSLPVEAHAGACCSPIGSTLAVSATARTATAPARTWRTASGERFRTLLRARHRPRFQRYKENTLIRRIQRRMQVLHIDDVPSYVERLKADRGELEALFHELLIGVTQFFRDPDAFEALKSDGDAEFVGDQGSRRADPHLGAGLRHAARKSIPSRSSSRRRWSSGKSRRMSRSSRPISTSRP